MDESSPVYENFMNKMSAMSGDQRLTEPLQHRCECFGEKSCEQFRKITIIKSILKNQKIDMERS